ncbi:MAG: hypothetical protein ACYC0V_10840 [Armatimonadota bacterium]
MRGETFAYHSILRIHVSPLKRCHSRLRSGIQEGMAYPSAIWSFIPSQRKNVDLSTQSRI